jgi:hypothetical protein
VAAEPLDAGAGSLELALGEHAVAIATANTEAPSQGPRAARDESPVGHDAVAGVARGVVDLEDFGGRIGRGA